MIVQCWDADDGNDISDNFHLDMMMSNTILGWLNELNDDWPTCVEVMSHITFRIL